MSSDESNNKKGWPTEAAVREFAAGKTRAAYDAARGSIGGPPAVHLARIYGKTFAEIRDGRVWPSAEDVRPFIGEMSLKAYANHDHDTDVYEDPSALHLFVKGTSGESGTISLPDPPDGFSWNPAFMAGFREKLHEIMLQKCSPTIAQVRERLDDDAADLDDMYVAMQTALDRIDSGDHDAAREALDAALKRHTTR